MKQSVRKALLAAAAASSVIALTTPAHATGQRLATPQAITLTNSGNVSVKDNTTGAGWSCTTSKGTGTADVSDPASNPVFRVNSLTAASPSTGWNGWCNGFFALQVTADTTTPWAFNVTGPTVSGVTPGTLTGVKLSLLSSDACHAPLAGPGGVGGTLSGKYNNATHALTIGGLGSTSNLTVQSVDANCDPVLTDVGDSFSIHGTYSISPYVVINIPSLSSDPRKNLTRMSLGR
ncbi:hypothetical protein [Actinomadura oligospora]|uniref:hypothetical protein n=1 Tax=Actinomadura oligospora TaxID=111804 RepID=UPI00047BEA60|nr:hypothetical protein [Actinomadura oligospora]